jgi:hypothetical protein
MIREAFLAKNGARAFMDELQDELDSLFVVAVKDGSGG